MGKTESPVVGNVESPEARAAAKWVAQRFGLIDDCVSRVNFTYEYSPGCDTCDYGSTRTNLSYTYNGSYETAEIEISAGDFIKECVALL